MVPSTQPSQALAPHPFRPLPLASRDSDRELGVGVVYLFRNRKVGWWQGPTGGLAATSEKAPCPPLPPPPGVVGGDSLWTPDQDFVPGRAPK